MRELIILGTASQVPTRTRNHNGYFLRWDDDGFLFDPGEGTQRQMTLAGVAAPDVTRLCVTHFHGDHCFGLPGVFSRIALDQVSHPVHCHFPASGAGLFDRLCWMWPDYRARILREEPAFGERTVLATSSAGSFSRLEAVRLSHGVEAYGYRITEPDGRRMLPAKLAEAGVRGPLIGELQREGRVTGADGREVTLEEVSVPRPGQVFAFVMDTRVCQGVYDLAANADMLVIESTFLTAEAALAAEHGHMTARQAAAVAEESGVRSLVLTHFSQRYTDLSRFELEAREVFTGELHIAEDLMRIPFPKRAAA
ncbi:ribonuclease Z [Actinospica sp. MGRD01-02]|uniref:Ribonuclease Z n=1 Tax=Actinospica acidithermotolerans TaxID=2828514 RepID=A0A941IP07_9ACTN|nr:ribonuclease Z [Actinospica acidithermotolerans]MBR7829991.1 ribonuclease Z [Actinospica acidithermotolerans]